MNIRKQKGFTLIKVMVVTGTVAMLAAFPVPMVCAQSDPSAIARAQADVKSIAAAIQAFRQDTGTWPNLSGGTFPCSTPAKGGDATVVPVLSTAGNLPRIASGLPGTHGWPMSETVLMTTLLRDNPASAAPANNCYPLPVNATSPGWKGPYLTEASADPWGNAYIVNAADFEGSPDGVWVISAGPDGIIETGAGAKTLVKDDIGVLIK
jgi:type II secretory pathway pseudopilin PulG